MSTRNQEDARRQQAASHAACLWLVGFLAAGGAVAGFLGERYSPLVICVVLTLFVAGIAWEDRRRMHAAIRKDWEAEERGAIPGDRSAQRRPG